jgi:hypothetical protein
MSKPVSVNLEYDVAILTSNNVLDLVTGKKGRVGNINMHAGTLYNGEGLTPWTKINLQKNR